MKNTFISKGIRIADLSLFFEKEKILIIADTHIGYEEALNRQGVLIPRTTFKEMYKRINTLLESLDPLSKIIINGDIKHEFGDISEQEWRDTLKLLDLLSRFSEEIILIRGNHDKILGPIADKRNIKIKDHVMINKTLFIHGHKIPKELTATKKSGISTFDTIVIGHEHPAVSLGEKKEKFKCFLKGKCRIKNKDNKHQQKEYQLIVMPSYFLVRAGTDVRNENLLSPFLAAGVKDFEVFIIESEKEDQMGKVMAFGRVKDLP